MGKKQGFIARATNPDGREAIYRYYHPKEDDWQDFPEEISILWKYPGAGLPDDDLRAMMEQMDGALDPLLDDDQAHLPLVITGMGCKEWVYYARSYERFMGRLNELLAGKPRYPIEIKHSHDPEWVYWHRVVDRLVKSGGD